MITSFDNTDMVSQWLWLRRQEVSTLSYHCHFIN
jgi:hypothetical protein